MRRNLLDASARATQDAAGDMPRTEQRMYWVVHHIAHTSCQGECAWDEDTVDAFTDAFPESEATLKVYIMGANGNPMLNRAAKRAHLNGFISPGVVGNMDARQYNQRTWCRYWSLTERGAKLVDVEFQKD